MEAEIAEEQSDNPQPATVAEPSSTVDQAFQSEITK
jgi:hypothetical protein